MKMKEMSIFKQLTLSIIIKKKLKLQKKILIQYPITLEYS